MNAQVKVRREIGSRMVELPRSLPEIPTDVVDQFPSLAHWKADFERWWFDFRTILQEDPLRDLVNGTINDITTFKSSTTTSLSSINDRLTDLETELAGIDTTGSTGTDYSNEISVLQITVNSFQSTISTIQSQIQQLFSLVGSLNLVRVEHIQVSPTTPWVINYGINRKPASIVVWDNDDEKIEPDADITGTGQVSLTFAGSTAGRAELVI